ncbi:MAG TPA: hypothetical protein VET26_04925 [Candidatus Sulfotelmatobacter sp.]|nr:hypothetical protein [Candidatus Sulfotelmatobacter sp.]
MNGQTTSVTTKLVRIFAATVAGFGVLCGVIGLALVVGGNKYLSDGATITVLVALTLVALAAIAVAWWHPIPAALAMAVAAVGYFYALNAALGGWWAAYQTAVQTSGSAENDFWFGGGTPIALFLIGAGLFAIGAILAFFGCDWRAGENRQALPVA